MPAVHEWVITGAYGLFSLLSLAEVLALRRVGPSGQKTGPLPTLLIAGSNGEDWLRDAMPLLKEEGFRIYYYDLESSDKSIKVAREQGVTVLTGRPPKDAVPLWHACHRLALAASEDSPDEWWAFMPMLGIPSRGFADSLRSWIKKEGRGSSHFAGRPCLPDSSPLELLTLLWYQWLPGALHRIRAGTPSPTPLDCGLDSTVHLWKASRCMEAVFAEAKPPFYGCDPKQEKQLKPRTGLLTHLHHVNITELPQERLTMLRLIVPAWGWILAGSLWPVALTFLLVSYLSVALTSKNILKAMVVLPLSVAVAPGIMLRKHFIHISKRSNR